MAMKITAIYGNPKHAGFVHDCLDVVTKHLEQNGLDVDRLKLVDADIRDCVGCFQCLRTGKCSIHDDMEEIIASMREADGFITGASVRNGYFPAMYKRFYERITYILGFGRELRGKYVSAVGAVGMAPGKKHLGKLLTLREFQTNVQDYLFFRTGIPTKIKAEDVTHKLEGLADRLKAAISSGAGLPLSARIRAEIDDFVIRKFMLEKNPNNVYDFVIRQWKQKKLM